MNVICLAIDRLHAGYLGCYGNSWVETPSFDRLAAEGFTWDQALAESPDLAEFYASLATGTHVFDRRMAGAGASGKDSLVDRLVAAGLRTALVTDEPAVANWPWAAALDDVVHVPRQPAADAAPKIETTHFARFFALLGDWLSTAEGPFALFAHTAGCAAEWDAPREFRQRYVDQDEPDPPDFTAVPCRMLPEGYDPDELLGITQAYAGQVALLDVCLGALVDELESRTWARDTMLVVISPRGFPLGEHRRIGPFDGALYGETVHVPWLFRWFDGLGVAQRSGALVQPCDLAPTLLEWLGLAPIAPDGRGRSLLSIVRGDIDAVRDVAFVANGAGNVAAVRTPAWYYRATADDAEAAGRLASDDSPRGELFAKPDDRWEVNDVADRCPEVVELLEMLRASAASRDATAGPATPLPDVLVSGID